MTRLLIATVVVVCLLLATPVTARITKIEIAETADTPGAPGYQTITGIAYGEVDPTHPLNAIIQDIELAPRNERGMVEYSMDFTIQRREDGGNGLLFYEAVNRGWPLIEMPSFAPQLGKLARQRGYTLVWSGWQGNVPKNMKIQHTIQLPVATNDGKEITGWVRTYLEVTTPAASVPLTGSGLGAYAGYAPVDLLGSDAVLTRRIHPEDPQSVVPRDEWAFANCNEETPFPGESSATHICLKDGLEPGYVYELVYLAKNPVVHGLGLAATRDFISFLRHEVADDLGTPNPIKDTTRAAVLHGMSLSGFFVRTFLQLGFNQDEAGRIVFEGMNPHIGPTRVEINVRFSLVGHEHASRVGHLRPGWQSPYSWMPEYDGVAEHAGWLFQRCLNTATCPKIMETVSSSEYWNMRASLSTPDAQGQYDAWLPRHVRMYQIAGTQHSPASDELTTGICQQVQNPNDWKPYMRALFVALEGWVMEGTEPPPSEIPRLNDGTLVAPDAVSIGWPDIPGVKYTGRINALPLVDFGPDFDAMDMSGFPAKAPQVQAGREYAVLVPKVDVDGNEIAGILPATLQAPIATYTGWNLQRSEFGEDELCMNTGSFIPFAITKAEREAAGDPRLSLEERYGDHEGYVDAVREAASRLVAQRFLLPEDAAAIVQEAEDSDVLVPPETENKAPVAVITPVGQTVASMQAALDGSKSWDPDGDPITYSWRATGMAALIMGAETATPAVQFQSGAGSYTFELAVTDDKGASGTATTTVVYMGP